MGCSPLLGDHLGSTSMVTGYSGDDDPERGEIFRLWGDPLRFRTMTTDYLYTGQREEAEIGLYYCSPLLGDHLGSTSMATDDTGDLGQ